MRRNDNDVIQKFSEDALLGRTFTLSPNLTLFFSKDVILLYSDNVRNLSCQLQLTFMEYLLWTIVGLVAYSIVAPLVSIITEDIKPVVGLFFSTIVFLLIAIFVVIITGTADLNYAIRGEAVFIYAAGIFLAIGILAYVSALELGPVSIVVPIYGMFIVGSSALGIIFLHEDFNVTRIVGITCAVAAIILGAGEDE